jgi:hypothetical protein
MVNGIYQKRIVITELSAKIAAEEFQRSDAIVNPAKYPKWTPSQSLRGNALIGILRG